MYRPIITEELQSFIRTKKKIEKVYFNKDGRHYFNVYQLRASKADETPEKDWKLYGTGLFSHQEVIPGIHNVDKKKESICKGDPESTIVELFNGKMFLTRAEILSAEIKKSGDSLVAKVMNSSEAEKAMIAEAILPKSIVEMLRKMEAAQAAGETKDDENPPI